jgi:hypothetical protein
MEENLRKITEGKRIVLVGNSVEMLQHDLADYIESFDTIVRFGNGIPTVENWDSIGTRTDIWVTGFLRYNKRRFFPKNIPVLFNRSRVHLDNLYCDEKHKIPFEFINMFSDDELWKIYEMVGAKNGVPDGARPSAGFVTLQYFLQKTNFSSLTLVGFDFFSKSLSIIAGFGKPSSWHIPNNQLGVNPHSPKEKEIVYELYQKGVIDWKILSDLNDEELDLS